MFSYSLRDIYHGIYLCVRVPPCVCVFVKEVQRSSGCHRGKIYYSPDCVLAWRLFEFCSDCCSVVWE